MDPQQENGEKDKPVPFPPPDGVFLSFLPAIAPFSPPPRKSPGRREGVNKGLPRKLRWGDFKRKGGGTWSQSCREGKTRARFVHRNLERLALLQE